MSKTGGGNNKIEAETLESNVYFRVVEHLYQNTLAMHGDKLERYDTRIVQAKIRSKVKAEGLVKKLETEASAGNLSEQLRYEVEEYSFIRKPK